MTKRRKIQLLLWSYFWMLLLEGAFRRWILPGLSDLFLVARDPICMLALLLGSSLFFRSGWAKAFAFAGIVAAFLAVTVGHGSPFAAGYGLRIYLLHFPLMFLFAAVFDRSDVWKFAKMCLLVAIPMTALMGFQHYLPQTHWVNVGLGGVDSAGFAGALGRYRPPGTFSFITGPSMFFPLCAALLAALFLAGYRPMPKWIWISTAALVMALPLSVSRTLGFSYFLVGFATLISGALSPRLLARVLGVMLAISVVGLIVSRTNTYQDSMKAFNARWEGANEQEGGEEGATGALQHRTIGWIGLDLVRAFNQAPILGVGLGSGTSGGAKMIAGKRALNFGEGEWGILLFELGHLLGVIVLIIRVALSGYLVANSILGVRRGNGAALPLAMLAGTWLVIGISGQPTSLGFMVMGVGLCLTMLREPVAANRNWNRSRAQSPVLASTQASFHAARLR
jgi:hypothetical protein